jgi:hypothetical protein
MTIARWWRQPAESRLCDDDVGISPIDAPDIADVDAAVNY